MLRQAGGIRRGRKQAVGKGCPTTVLRTGGGGPKMRHLVLYKLAGFFHADKTPCACFFRGAMLVHESQKNTVFGKFLYIFDRKMQYFHLFCTKNALFLHSRGTSVHFRVFAKTRLFACAHVCTLATPAVTPSHARVHDKFFK